MRKNTIATPSTTPLTPEQRFKKLVGKSDPKTQCQEWLGVCFSSGYGQFYDKGVHYAHRYAWSMANKQPVPAGKYVLHSCDNPRCVRASHLRLGSAADNANDKMLRGRSTKGRSITKRPFLPAEIDQIVMMAAQGASQYRIAKATDRAEPVISGVLKRNADAIALKKIKNQFADALQALNDHLAPSIAAIEKITKKAA